MNKSELRRINKEKRRSLSYDEIKEKSKKASVLFLKSDIYKNAKTIMLYYPLGNETDTSYIFECAAKDKKNIVYPITDMKTNYLTAVIADDGTSFSKGGYSVFEPNSDKVIDKNTIDVVIVPGIAFDKKGYRVGFGKGCYDRFLEDINALKIGFCYNFQIADAILFDEHDICMDYLISEDGLIDCE